MNKEDKRRFHAITGSVMCLGQVTRYDIGYVVNQLARAMCKPFKAHMAAAKHLLRYLAETTNFAITYKRGGFKLTAFSDANWGNNPDNGKSTSSYIAFLSDGPVSFKVGLQGLTAQSTMEAELVAAALTMKEAVFCSNMTKELGFGMRFNNVPVYIDNASTLHVAGNQTYSPRVKHVALRFYFVQELVKEGRISIHYGEPTCWHRYQASQQAQAPVPHQTNRRLQSLNRIRGTFPCCSGSRRYRSSRRTGE